MNDVIKSINVDGVEYDIQAKELTKVTYAELKELRDNGGLVAGHLYRITDYEFTTKQVETKSAGHVFDIIVLAVAENESSHIARAIAHEGDTYFDGNDLGAGELWYELDNDAEKYAWADAENGKGIIYRMIDEKRNDCPYDFKNALFLNTKYTSHTTADNYYYTFSYVVNSVLYDGTVEKQVTTCYGNSMGVTWTLLNKKEMNRNVFKTVFFNNSCRSNTFGNDCHSNTFKNSCSSNTFGNSCYSNTFGDSCVNNTFGNECYSNTFVEDCDDNTLSNNVSNRKVNSSKTSITLNDEYFDDGSGQLVPVKHPDLSTQPSILPYKFMGQYVYEQLIPVKRGLRIIANSFSVEKPMIVSAAMFNRYSFANIDVVAVNSTSMLLKEELSIDGYLCVKYTDGNSLDEGRGGYYGYGDDSATKEDYVDFGAMEDGTIYLYFSSTKTLSLSKSGEITKESIPSDYKESRHIILENGVTSIKSSVFYGNKALTSITIPESVTNIGERAFYGCSSLASINIPTGVTSIGSETFHSCSSLASITIPENVTSIGNSAFISAGLRTIVIPQNVKTIGSDAFYQNTNLTSITCESTTPPLLGNANVFKDVDKTIPVYVPADSIDSYKSDIRWGEFTNIQAIVE